MVRRPAPCCDANEHGQSIHRIRSSAGCSAGCNRDALRTRSMQHPPTMWAGRRRRARRDDEIDTIPFFATTITQKCCVQYWQRCVLGRDEIGARCAIKGVVLLWERERTPKQTGPPGPWERWYSGPACFYSADNEPFGPRWPWERWYSGLKGYFPALAILRFRTFPRCIPPAPL